MELELLDDLMAAHPSTYIGRRIANTVGDAVSRIPSATSPRQFETIVDLLFADHCMHWGRIAVSYAYAAKCARTAPHYRETFARIVATKTNGWITSNGGWQSFGTSPNMWSLLLDLF